MYRTSHPDPADDGDAPLPPSPPPPQLATGQSFLYQTFNLANLGGMLWPSMVLVSEIVQAREGRRGRGEGARGGVL